MQNYTDSDYALNVHSEKSIVYRFVDEIIEIKAADLLEDNSIENESDFQTWKDLSNSIYLEQDRDENAKTKKNSPYDELDETLLCHAKSPEDLLIGEIDTQDEEERLLQRKKIAKFALKNLTEIQRKRYVLYHAYSKTIREIAEIEGVHFTSVQESLVSAEKKIENFRKKT